ncbi:MAG: TetR/AcrR family transcriptional regulator [Rhodospirillaceae bacterium]
MAPCPSPPEPETASKAAQVRAAAAALFLEHGYGATSMDAVARTAGVSKATVYAHFAGKAELFAAIIADACARAVPAPAESGQTETESDGQPIAETLFHLGRVILDLLLSPEALAIYRVVMAETSRFPELGQAFYHSGPERTLGMVIGTLGRAERRGQLTLTDPQSAAEQFLGMIRSHYHLRCLLGIAPPPDPVERDRQVRATVTMFLRAYCPSRSEQ